MNLVFIIRDDRKDSYRQVLFMFMIHFVIAHEFAQILHGHLRYGYNEKIMKYLMMQNLRIQS